MEKAVGLHLAWCVLAIAEGTVALESVRTIVSSTECRTENDWKRVLATYCDVYWPVETVATCVPIFWQLLATGRVQQPLFAGAALPPEMTGVVGSHNCWKKEGVQ